MKAFPFLLFVFFSVTLVASQEQSQKKKDDISSNITAKRYQSQEPLFRPPPLPIQRRTAPVDSRAEQPPSFFESQHKKSAVAAPTDKLETRQFNIQQLDQQQFQPQNSFNNFQQQQPNNFQQQQQQQPQNQQFQQRQQHSLDQNQFQQFDQQQQQQQQQAPQQNFQQFEQQQQAAAAQQSFQDPNNFQSRQQENFATLPPVFIPPNQPIGPPPALQSPIRNLFREPEPPFSLAGIFQRFLRLFNLGNN